MEILALQVTLLMDAAAIACGDMLDDLYRGTAATATNGQMNIAGLEHAGRRRSLACRALRHRGEGA